MIEPVIELVCVLCAEGEPAHSREMVKSINFSLQVQLCANLLCSRPWSNATTAQGSPLDPMARRALDWNPHPHPQSKRERNSDHDLAKAPGHWALDHSCVLMKARDWQGGERHAAWDCRKRTARKAVMFQRKPKGIIKSCHCTQQSITSPSCLT